MGSFIDLTGDRYGRLYVVKRAKNIGNRTAWLCLCDCGNHVIVKSNHLRTGNTKSCGCFHRDRASEANLIHGFARRGTETLVLFKIWRNIISRCYNPKDKHYYDYGGRGIDVCERWLESFENFMQDMGERPGPDYTVERLNNDRGYSPDNCVWAKRTQQSRNQRISKRNKTGVRGVYWHKRFNKYVARIFVEGRSMSLGYFNSIEAATHARKQAENKYWKRTS